MKNVNEKADSMVDVILPCLDHGFVRLVDYMGGDARIVQAARVSYGEGTKTYREDRGLIDYLLRNEHTSPFEQVVLTFHCKMPIFVARQWVRHRTARLNEISGRYSVMKDEFYTPAPEDICVQSQDNKQGRGEPVEDPETWGKWFRSGGAMAFEGYHHAIDEGISRELARINLPLSTYTEWYWQIDLHNLFHFLKLRLHPHAQKEIRVYAEAMLQVAEAVAPLATEAFKEHILYGARFSMTEMAVLWQIVVTQNSKEDIRAMFASEKEFDRFLEKFGR